MSKPSRAAVLLALLLVYIIWGSTYLAIHFAVVALPPFAVASVRFLVAGAILYIWTRARGVPNPTIANWRAAFIVGTLLLLGGNGLVSLAEQHHVPSGLTALLVAMSPIWMALIDWLRPHGLRPSLLVALGLLLGFGGVALLIAPQILAGGVQGGPLWAMLIVPLSSLCWATGSIVARNASMPASPLMGNGIEMLAGGVSLGIVSLLTGEWQQIRPEQITTSALLALAYLIVFGSLLGFTAYVWLLRNTPLSLASTYAYVNPVVAVFLGWALAGEQLSLMTLVAAAVIVVSVCVISLFRSPAGTAVAQEVLQDASAPSAAEDMAALSGRR